MRPIIGVEIENRHLVELCVLQGKTEGLLKLTTLKPKQRRASIKVFLVRHYSKVCITEFRLQNLDRDPKRNPAIDLSAEYNGRFTLRFTLILNGKVYETRTISLATYMPQQVFLRRILPPAAAGVAVLVFVLFFLPRMRESDMGKDVQALPSARQARNEEQEKEEPPAGPFRDTNGGDTQETGTPPGPPQEPAGTPTAVEESPAPGSQQTRREEGDRIVRFDTVTVYFEPDKAVLTPETRNILSETAVLLNEYGGPVKISGHCASYGTEAGRMELSRRRAKVVYNYLLDCGWEPEQKPHIEGYGSTAPAVEESDKQHLNRRVEISPLR